MTLGVYWYYKFPDGLYEYNFFKFHNGSGGHADAPAELIADVEISNGDRFVGDLHGLVGDCNDTFVFIRRSGNSMRISIGGYRIFDFEFALALEVEKLLTTYRAIHTNNIPTNSVLTRLASDENQTRISRKYLYHVSSAPGHYNAETANIRFDCNIAIDKKDFFLQALTDILPAANIAVAYYLEKNCQDRINIMLFFLNGRQGVNLTSKQKINIDIFENNLDTIIQNYEVHIGHLPGSGYYPKGKVNVLKIIDEDFIIRRV